MAAAASETPASGAASDGGPASGLPKEVVVHPIVLLSVVDHYNRVAKDTQKRVVGVLLGESFRGVVDVTTSFAVPFEEDPRDPEIWYLDHNYLEVMAAMFRKVNSKERIVGFYSTGPKIRPADIRLDAMFRRLHPSPVLVIVDVRPDVEGIPTQAYVSVEEVTEGRETARTFAHVASSVGAHEPEEIGVEHLLRDVNDPSVSDLAAEVRHKLLGLRGLAERLREVAEYLGAVLEGTMPANQDILANIQTMLNLLPNLTLPSLAAAITSVTNDAHLAMYLGALIRSVVSLHDLVTNKIAFREGEEESERAEKDKKDAKKDDKRERTASTAGKGGEGGKGGGAGEGKP